MATKKSYQLSLKHLGNLYLLCGVAWLLAALILGLDTFSDLTEFHIAGLPIDASAVLNLSSHLTSGLLIFFEGILLCYTANHPNKTTLLYIVTLLSLAIEISILIVSGFSTFFAIDGGLHLINFILDGYIFYILHQYRK